MPRPKGSKNQRTIDLELYLHENNFNPAAALVDVHRRAMKAYDEDKGLREGDGYCVDNRHKYLEIAGNTAGKLMDYLYPKRKAVDIRAEKEALQTFADIAAAAKKRKKTRESGAE